MCCLNKCSRFSSVKISLSSAGVLHSTSSKPQILQIGKNDKKKHTDNPRKVVSINCARNYSLLSTPNRDHDVSLTSLPPILKKYVF